MHAIAGARQDTSSRTSTANWRQYLTPTTIPLEHAVQTVCNSKGEPPQPLYTTKRRQHRQTPVCFQRTRKPLLTIDAGASRFGPVIFTDSLSERFRWLELAIFQVPGGFTSNPEAGLAWRFQANALIQLQFGTSEWISTRKTHSLHLAVWSAYKVGRRVVAEVNHSLPGCSKARAIGNYFSQVLSGY
jgi:hypothetical protein